MKLTKWLKPLLPDGGREDVKYLILWTFPGQVTLKVNKAREDSDKPIYYCNLNNNFWYIIEMVFGKNSKEERDIFRKHYESMKKAIEMIQKLQKLQKNRVTHDSYLEIIHDELEKVYDYEKKICTMYRIALRDRVDECYLSDSSQDAKRLPKEYHNFYEYTMKPNKDGKDIVVLLNWVSEGEKLEVSAQLKRDFENGEISKDDRKKLKKWMNYCLIDPSFLVPKQSTSSSNRKWIREILDDWRKDL